VPAIASCFFEQRLDVRLPGNVAHHKAHASIATAGGFRECRSGSVDPNDICAVLGKADRETTAYSRAGSGDDQGFPSKSMLNSLLEEIRRVVRSLRLRPVGRWRRSSGSGS
jgi:hypothetical protein